MQVVAGISLFILGSIAVVIANFVHMQAEVDLLEKRPELAKWFTANGLVDQSHGKLQSFIERNFPRDDESRIRGVGR